MPNPPEDRSSDKARIVSLTDYRNKRKAGVEEAMTAPTSLAHPAVRAMRAREAAKNNED